LFFLAPLFFRLILICSFSFFHYTVTTNLLPLDFNVIAPSLPS
jgi:hypothetical protein